MIIVNFKMIVKILIKLMKYFALLHKSLSQIHWNQLKIQNPLIQIVNLQQHQSIILLLRILSFQNQLLIYLYFLVLLSTFLFFQFIFYDLYKYIQLNQVLKIQRISQYSLDLNKMTPMSKKFYVLQVNYLKKPFLLYLFYFMKHLLSLIISQFMETSMLYLMYPVLKKEQILFQLFFWKPSHSSVKFITKTVIKFSQIIIKI